MCYCGLDPWEPEQVLYTNCGENCKGSSGSVAGKESLGQTKRLSTPKHESGFMEGVAM